MNLIIDPNLKIQHGSPKDQQSERCSHILFISIFVSLNQIYTHCCPTSICRHVATLLVWAKYSNIGFFIDINIWKDSKWFSDFLLEQIYLGCDVIPSSNFQLPWYIEHGIRVLVKVTVAKVHFNR